MQVEPGRPVGYDPEADRPPARPATLDEFPFTRQPAVRWFNPSVQGPAALQVAMSSAFGGYLDKRELQAVIDQRPFTELADRDEVWLDFAADTGDGFDATFTVASLLGRAQLDVDGVDEPLPRADVLTFGGDLVYPDATVSRYEDRLVGPFTAALPWTPPDRRPTMMAIPGNHDWYDGLTAFMRVFGQQKSIGGWQTCQTRSYFALQLPHRWWLWGIDVEFDAYIDEPQLRYFEDLEVAAGDRIILCTSEPNWVGTAAERAAFRNLGYVERKLIEPRDARLAVTLCGHLHHYSRYEAQGGDGHKIIAGAGGAFLYPTHGMPATLPVRTDPDDPDTETIHQLAATYPSPRRSRWLAFGALTLPWHNPSFMLLPAVVHLLLAVQVLVELRSRAAVQAGADATGAEAGARLLELLGALTAGDVVALLFVRPMALAILVLVLLVLVWFARPRRGTRPRAVNRIKVVMGVAHTALHVVVAVVVTWAALRLASLADGWIVTPISYVAALVLGGLIGSLAVGVYLTAASAIWGAEANHAFSAQRRPDHRNFVRLHVREDGALDLFAIGVDRAGRRWRAVPDGDDEDAWAEPADRPLAPHLIERITIPGDASDPSVSSPST
jgi:hypothetical protein